MRSAVSAVPARCGGFVQVPEAGTARGGVCPACDLAVSHFWQFRSGASFPLLQIIFTQLSVSLTTMSIYFIPISSSN